MIFNQTKQIKHLGLDPFLKTILCFDFYVSLFFWVSIVHSLLFVSIFVLFLYLFTDVIIDFNFYLIINKQYIHTYKNVLFFKLTQISVFLQRFWTCLNFSINWNQLSICWKCQIFKNLAVTQNATNTKRIAIAIILSSLFFATANLDGLIKVARQIFQIC